MSEANKEEVDKCKQIARSAMAAGDKDKALRFLDKAKRMSSGADPSIDALIAEAMRGGSAAASGAADAGGRSSDSAGPRFRGATASAGGAGATRVNKAGQTYTPEMAKEVQRILRTRDYYEILGLSRDAGDDAVKKAYKKLALKLHPDKNTAPGAEEAFKKVSKAFQCLQDQDKKQVYDKYGDEDRIPQQQRQHYQQDFMQPEDLFAAFFGGGVPFGSGGGGHHRQHHSDDQNGTGNKVHLFQMLPVVLLILLTLLSNFSTRDAGTLFRFTEQGPYQDRRISETLEVHYYVQTGFEERYPDHSRALAEFEREVEKYYIRRLHSKCDDEVKAKHRAEMQARRMGSREDFEKARNHPRKACKELVRIEKNHYDLYRSAMFMAY
mmetsp:Transcript_18089/g.41934  ORF Transcript_18089/g.41934 Transcript_18089/m.41934 type:complete len:381 (-) Transcript_18089:127-1269(-)